MMGANPKADKAKVRPFGLGDAVVAVGAARDECHHRALAPSSALDSKPSISGRHLMPVVVIRLAS